jgi:hypothetical protein
MLYFSCYLELFDEKPVFDQTDFPSSVRRSMVEVPVLIETGDICF